MLFRATREPLLLPEQVVVNGERHYGDNIRYVLSRAGGVLQYECQAVLRRERDNPADKNAVEVTVEGLRVGYISRVHAADVARRIGDREVVISCVILWNGESVNGIYRVKLFPEL